jgi:TRIAD3 protein (E3 ubiquitin-protein ligase RNF216)
MFDAELDDDLDFIGLDFTDDPDRPPAFDQPLPMQTVFFRGRSISLPVVPDSLRTAIRDAIKIEPTLDLTQASNFLTQAVKHARPIDKLVDRIVLEASAPRMRDYDHCFRTALDHLLHFLFPRHRSRDLKAIVRSSRTFSEAMQKVTTDASTVKAARQPGPLFVLEDVSLAVQVLDVIDAEAAGAHQHRFQKALSAGNLETCACCFGSVLREDLCHCAAGHQFCLACLERGIETVLGEGRSALKCLAMGDCGAEIVTQELIEKVNERTLTRLFVAQGEAAAHQAGLDRLVKCHHCGYVVEFDQSGLFHCRECGANTCTGCGRIAHEGLSCDAAAGMQAQGTEVRLTDAVVHACPKCRTQYVKDEGCNRMECPKCQTWMCFWCEKVIPKEVGYDHFWRSPVGCPPDRCPLWVSNDTFNKIQAVRAGMGAG